MNKRDGRLHEFIGELLEYGYERFPPDPYGALICKKKLECGLELCFHFYEKEAMFGFLLEGRREMVCFRADSIGELFIIERALNTYKVIKMD